MLHRKNHKAFYKSCIRNLDSYLLVLLSYQCYLAMCQYGSYPPAGIYKVFKKLLNYEKTVIAHHIPDPDPNRLPGYDKTNK